MVPQKISGDFVIDSRGKLSFNNSFNAFGIKRIYSIENSSLSIQRGWQGHRIEKRWFLAVKGKFKIDVIKIDNWEQPNPMLDILGYTIHSNSMDILYIPEGYITKISALEDDSKLIVFSNYLLNEIDDEYRFDLDYFSS